LDAPKEIRFDKSPTASGKAPRGLCAPDEGNIDPAGTLKPAQKRLKVPERQSATQLDSLTDGIDVPYTAVPKPKGNLFP
jgi:hypothetical protein